ncbi:MAG: cellulose biosynthesis cyclic di-GMP-binding regulatory protein BcsB [Myxococcales bacterium]
MTALLALLLAARVLELGPTRAQRESAATSLDFSFAARADEELTGATVHLTLDRITSVEVLVNDEPVAVLSDVSGAREIPVPKELLADRNSLGLRLQDAKGTCIARPGAWRGLQKVAVALDADPTPLPDDLALLPLPFFDRGYDSDAKVPIAFAAADEAPLAALAASWFAVDAPIPLTFEAHLGSLPDSRAVVLVASASEASRYGLPAPNGPSVRMIDHPLHPGSNVKLVVIAGRNRAELSGAIVALAARTRRLAGPEVKLLPTATKPIADPPRWVGTGREVPFSAYPGEHELSHEGSAPATLSLRFRVAPDLWLWPADFVALDLGWRTRGSPRPRLDVEMNGDFVATLPDKSEGRARLRIPREHLRGFNELLVHVHYPDPDPCGVASPQGDPPRVEIAPDSVLHVEGAQHFSMLPDLSLFAFDGWPFTRAADLSGTAVVLPDRPSPAELGTAFSMIARMAQVTGSVGTGVTLLVASTATDEDLANRDVLVVGTPGDNAVVARWADRLPLRFENGRARVRRPPISLDLLGGIGPLLDERRANDLLSQSRDVAAIAAIESPVTKGRSVVAVTALDPDRIPPFSAFLGYAKARTRAGDLLLVAGEQRAMFRVGGWFGLGRLDKWTEVRWFFASHFLVLVPVAFAGAFAFAFDARRFLARKRKRRLAEGGPA